MFPREYRYEHIEAASPEDAEAHVIETEFAGDYENILSVEVKRQCECGYDNDPDNARCEVCRALLHANQENAMEKKTTYKAEFEAKLRALIGRGDADEIVSFASAELVTSWKNGLQAGQKRAGKPSLAKTQGSV